jgi:hypothetical protein
MDRLNHRLGDFGIGREVPDSMRKTFAAVLSIKTSRISTMRDNVTPSGDDVGCIGGRAGDIGVDAMVGMISVQDRFAVSLE